MYKFLKRDAQDPESTLIMTVTDPRKRVAQPVLVCAVLLGLLTPTPAAIPQDEVQPLNIEDILSFIAYLQDKRAHLYTAGDRDRKFRKPGAFSANHRYVISTNEIDSKQDDDMSVDKRASYMTLCHFKICNMGRKRGFIRKASPNYIRRI